MSERIETRPLSGAMKAMLARLHTGSGLENLPSDGRKIQGLRKTLWALEARGLVIIVCEGDRFWDPRFCRWSIADESGGWALNEAGAQKAEELRQQR
tara:strand:+ start:347 stop:637 length:291 start_codon:yes stop_codon:yes gene_type:complete